MRLALCMYGEQTHLDLLLIIAFGSWQLIDMVKGKPHLDYGDGVTDEIDIVVD